jgi:predicted DNA binding CopG/RHH family protein
MRSRFEAMSDPDAEAFERYDEQARREPAPGRPRRRPDRALTEHVPVRFPTVTIEAVRQLAEADGMTVSAWIRRAVEAAARVRTNALSGESAELNEEAQVVVERLRKDVDDLVAALERSDRVA